ncbi:MAG TPA: hypothetical protein VF105_06065 [Gemmatimonadaceae bacterium]
MRRRLFAALTLVSVTISACSTYAPISMQLAPQAGTVRLSLSDAAHVENFGVLGSQISSIEGEVKAVSDSSVTIAASEVGRTAADNDRFRGETAVIPARYIVSVERKRVQVARSVLVAGLITGAVIWIGTSLGGGSVSYRKPSGPPIGGQ